MGIKTLRLGAFSWVCCVFLCLGHVSCSEEARKAPDEVRSPADHAPVEELGAIQGNLWSGGENNCCVSSSSPSCDDQTCSDCVSTVDLYCTGTAWDVSCVEAASSACQDVCGCVEACLTPVGDMTDSGTVDLFDVMCSILTSLAVLAGDDMPGCLAGQSYAADVSCDGNVSVLDTLFVINIALGNVLDAQLDSDGDSCPDACEEYATNVCEGAADGQVCDDGDRCTSGETCTGGVCGGGSALNCDGGNPCLDYACTPTNGCVTTTKSPGSACENGASAGCVGDAWHAQDVCDGAGICDDGGSTNCSFASTICSDGICDGTLGCLLDDKPAGTGCLIGSSAGCVGDTWHAQDACDGAGVCDDGGFSNCAAVSNQCTDGICDSGVGCVAENIPQGTPCGSSSAAECNGADTCDGAGFCDLNIAPTGTPCGDSTDTTCTNPDSCGNGTCSPNNASSSTSCSDNNMCTFDDLCEGGSCSGAAVNCSDADPCTTEECAPAQGCIITNLSCDDSDPCTNETCTTPPVFVVGFSPAPNPNGSKLVSSWSGDGIVATGYSTFTAVGSPGSSSPTNGGPYLRTSSSANGISFAMSDGALFNAHYVDLAEYSEFFSTSSVEVVGTYSDDTTVTVFFALDGVIDGSGSGADFETFYFTSEFEGLTSLFIDGNAWAVDNLTLSTGGGCSSVAINCDDANSCTNDSCAGGICAYTDNFVCGDGVCECGETASSCASDCSDPSSCVGKCGQNPGQCWCDSVCTAYGDCCDDACAECGFCGDQSCEGNCGGSAPGGCGCYYECAVFGSCCANFTFWCD